MVGFIEAESAQRAQRDNGAKSGTVVGDSMPMRRLLQ
jgi:hypothetical protein